MLPLRELLFNLLPLPPTPLELVAGGFLLVTEGRVCTCKDVHGTTPLGENMPCRCLGHAHWTSTLDKHTARTQCSQFGPLSPGYFITAGSLLGQLFNYLPLEPIQCFALLASLPGMVTLNAHLPAGLRNMLLAGLQQPLASPEERQELERLWVLSLSALEQFHQDLCRAHHLCQLFPLQGWGVQLLSTGVTGKTTDGGHKPWRRPSRKGTRSTEQLGAAPSLEEQIEHVGAMLLEMETRVNVPVWTVEATEETGPESSLAFEAEGSCSERQAAEVAGGLGCCGQCQDWPALCCTLS